VESIELNGRALQMAKPTHGGVAVKITGDSSITYGRHFDESNQIVSTINRDSIDALKQYFKDDLSQDDWRLVV
jgi:translation initiation factor 5B